MCLLSRSIHSIDVALFLWKFNDSSRCIGNERYICTTICKHTMNFGLWNFWKFRGNSGLIFKFLRLYVIFELILCFVQILSSGTVSLMYKMSLVHLRIKPRETCQHLHIGNYTKALTSPQFLSLADVVCYVLSVAKTGDCFVPISCLCRALK